MRSLPAVAAVLAAALAAACTTKPTPGVCCIGPEDCSRLDLNDDRPCPAGQACVDFTCVAASCANLGCPAEAPVCDVTTDACRGCQLDTECPSGACADDGACVAETGVVYLAPDGIDAGTCSRDAPCRRLQLGATRTSSTRNHIVMATGLYDLQGEQVEITAQNTPAQQLFIHGGGSVMSTISDGIFVAALINVVIRDLELIGNGTGFSTGPTARSILERVKIKGSNVVGIDDAGELQLRDISIEDAGVAIRLGFSARLALDRGVIKNPGIGISSLTSTTVVDISNLLVFGAYDVAFDLVSSAGGTVSFTTIADSGTDSGSGPRAFRCRPSGITVRSSIIWAPGSVERVAIDSGCTLVSSIVGPTAVPGATNVNPLFVDSASRNYHLSANSPARDMVDSGPAIDFEGDPRPRGARVDIGADEAP